MAVLQITTPSGTRVLDLPDGLVTIGRRSSNDVVIEDDRASRVHCSIRPAPGGFLLKDLESRNGVKVAGQKINGEKIIQFGEAFAIGATSLRVFEDSVPPVELDDTLVVEASAEAPLAEIVEDEEIINNALFHAFRNPDGSEKYRPGSFEFLDNNEEVAIEFGADATTIGFSVTDNRGTLTPELVIGKLARQYYREGLFDESGRGVYLARMLSGNMVINIHRGRRTQMICIFYEKRLNIPRPFSINYCE